MIGPCRCEVDEALLAGVLSALVMSRNTPRGHHINTLGLFLSSGYLAWSVAAKVQVEQLAYESLSTQGIEHHKFMSMPTPLNTLVWRVVAMDERGYYVGYLNLLNDGEDIVFTRYHSDPTLLTGLEDHWPVKRLQWFTKGFYATHEHNSDIVMTDLRMGLEPDDYVFSFKVGQISNPHSIARPSERVVKALRWERMLLVLQLIWRS